MALIPYDVTRHSFSAVRDIPNTFCRPYAAGGNPFLQCIATEKLPIVAWEYVNRPTITGRLVRLVAEHVIQHGDRVLQQP